MTTVTSSYLPGWWVAVSAPGAWLLVDLPPDSDTVRRCWQLLSAGAGSDDVLDALVAAGIRATPSFALLRLGGDERRAIVRGDAVVSVRGGDAFIDYHAGPRVWADESVDASAVEVRLSGPSTRNAAAGSVPLPMSAGVTMAAEIAVVLDGSDVIVSTEAPAVPVVVPPPPSTDEPAADPRADEPSPAQAAHEPSPAQAADEPSDPDADDEPGDESAEAGPSYDFLFGATQRPPVVTDIDRDAGDTAGWNTMIGVRGDSPDPVATEGDDTTEPMGELPSEPPPVTPVGELPREAPAPPVVESAGGLIDALPWETPAAPDVAPQEVPRWTPPVPAADPVRTAPEPPASEAPEPPVTEAPEAVARTTNRAALLASIGDATAPTGPTVLAGRCPNGHMSPAHAAVCRVCGTAMPAQQAVEIARPPLGVLRLSTGDVITLDRGVLLGRAPEAPADGDERPHLVRVISPENDVSRSHAEIVLDGWHVYVRDLGSTNGTTVTLPGQQPVRLREHDLQLLESNSVVTLADEVSCTFEVTG